MNLWRFANRPIETTISYSVTFCGLAKNPTFPQSSAAVPDLPSAEQPDLREAAEYRCLANPPIVEASIDFLVAFPKPFGLEAIKPLLQELDSEYPRNDEQRGLHQQFNVKQPLPGAKIEVDTPLVTDLGVQAVRLFSKDGHSVVIFRGNGMAFVRLAPYTSWDAIRDEALRIWTLFRRVAQPTEVSKLTVRYLNRITPPAGMFDFDDYLTVAPRVPKSLPDILGGFFSRILVPVDTSSVMISQALEPDLLQHRISIIIDLIASRQFSMNPDDDESLHDTLIQLRTIKNNAFFGSLTKRTLNLFS